MPTEEQTYRKNVEEKLDAILTQTTKTNGRVTRLEKTVLVVVTVFVVLLATRYPELAKLVVAL